MLRQYCFFNASLTKISSRHSLKAGTITTQHLMEATTLEPTIQHVWNLTIKKLRRNVYTLYPEERSFEEMALRKQREAGR